MTAVETFPISTADDNSRRIVVRRGLGESVTTRPRLNFDRKSSFLRATTEGNFVVGLTTTGGQRSESLLPDAVRSTMPRCPRTAPARLPTGRPAFRSSRIHHRASIAEETVDSLRARVLCVVLNVTNWELVRMSEITTWGLV